MIFQAIPPIDNPVVTGLVRRNPDEAPTIFGKMLSSIVGLLLVGSALWSFFQLIIGGLNWISSGGDKGKLETAQKKITNSLIGLIIVFSVWALFLVVEQFLGISILRGITLPSLI